MCKYIYIRIHFYTCALKPSLRQASDTIPTLDLSEITTDMSYVIFSFNLLLLLLNSTYLVVLVAKMYSNSEVFVCDSFIKKPVSIAWLNYVMNHVSTSHGILILKRIISCCRISILYFREQVTYAVSLSNLIYNT